jgi:hypothetical protein
MIMTRAPISERLAGRSVQVISSTIPPNVTLDEWRETRARKPSGSRRLRVLIEALAVTSPLKRQVT